MCLSVNVWYFNGLFAPLQLKYCILFGYRGKVEPMSHSPFCDATSNVLRTLAIVRSLCLLVT